MELVSEFIHNPLAQSLLLGPIMGVIFAALFSGLTKSPEAQAPATVTQTRTIYVTKVVERRRSSNESDDGMGLLIAGGIALIFIIWKYAIYFDTVQYYLATSILSVLSFSATTIIISLIKGHYTSDEWWFYTVGPMILLCVSIYILNLARISFDPSIQQGALNNTFWTFYKDWLSEYGRNFMFAHVSGVVILALAILLIAFSLIHYLSLMNQRSPGLTQSFWFFLTKSTSFFSGKLWFLFVAFLLGAAYCLINPDLVANWMTRK
ncbi:hypothetical protein [Microbulbifer rhizosphaerae]|uniref:Succinate dehydrogenase hydrophobic anchor subunit n=1 Tax=Microbulbifer rhizosphaerae TaxID=1562603 RepID=A0A7W4W7S4_9GAMM|nr:hypothetical protein [Microbulbifer rhizosphaerae]MBB3059285.1 succinate dehydrogenase hydrophobic anchor subunit [Microbulbifer rhizosphaerae]